MTLIEADASNLEVVCAAYLSQDKILMQELWDGVDIHGENQKALGFPSGPEYRLIAKIFQFRLIYGGSKFSYAMDPMFNKISAKPEFWDSIISNYYQKYKGLHAWHQALMRGVEKTGRWTSPTGRVYRYEIVRKANGSREWPRTTILNYPVQGLGADLMSIARVSAYKRLRELENLLFINTVHDSILLDLKEYNEELLSQLRGVFTDIPRNFEKLFGSKFNLPMKCKIKVGPNWKDMKEIE